MLTRQLLVLAAVGGFACGALTATSQVPPPAPASILPALENDLENLHKQIDGTLVRVSVTQSAVAVLDGRWLFSKMDFSTPTFKTLPPLHHRARRWWAIGPRRTRWAPRRRGGRTRRGRRGG